MEYYAGIDMSLKESSVRVVDATGKVVREAMVASEPEALIRYLEGLGCLSAASGSRLDRFRNGCKPGSPRLDSMLCCWRRGM